MKKFLFTIFILTGLLFLQGQAADWLNVHGYYKVFCIGIKVPEYQGQEQEQNNPLTNAPIGIANNRLRLKFFAKPTSWLSLDAEYDLSPRIQDPLLFTENVFILPSSPLTYRLVDFSPRFYPGAIDNVRSFGVLHNLDRLLFTVKTRAADIFIGRQAIAWGSARVFNPTDVVAPFAFNELDKEERLGVDAVRIRVPLGRLDELDIGYIFGKHFESQYSAIYVRGKTYVLKTDISGLVMRSRNNLLIGLDLARSIGGAGAWLEAAYVWPYQFAGQNVIDLIEQKYRKNYFRASIGIDYNFSKKFYGFFEYHFNSAGMSKPLYYNDVFLTIAFKEGSDYLLGKHYLNFGFTYQLGPLLPLNGLVIVNAGDGSVIFSPNVEYNIAENIYLGFGVYLSIGKKPGLVAVIPGAEVVRYHSEFGAYPAMVYTSFRVYF